MKDIFSFVTRNSLARDYAIAGGVMIILSVFAIHAISGVIETTRSKVRVETATLPPPRDEVRNYQVSRSVLDDAVATGSISRTTGGRPIILDPCTGQIKGQ